MSAVECSGDCLRAVNDSASDESYPSINDYELSFYFIFYKLTVPLLFSFVSLFGVIGNLLVIYVVLSTTDMRRNTVNVLLLNLAVSDLIFSVVCVPFIAYHYAADNWNIGSIICKLSQYLTYVTTYVTVYTLVAVAVVRVSKVTLSAGGTRDERHQAISASAGGCCHRQVSLVVCALWIVAVAANLPVVFSYRIKTYVTSLNASDVEPYQYCGIEDETQGWRIVITFFMFAYVAPLTVITSMYLVLLHRLRVHARNSSISVRSSHRQRSLSPTAATTAAAAAVFASQSVVAARTSTVVSRRASHVTRVLVVVVVVFAACWLPLHIHLLVAYCGVQPAQRWYEVYRVLAHCLAYANSCMNPVIYSYVSSDFRRRFSDVMLASQSCQCQPSTADSEADQPELPIMPRMRNESYEAIALQRRSNTPNHYVELHDTIHAV